jgi:hypothetical protein
MIGVLLNRAGDKDRSREKRDPGFVRGENPGSGVVTGGQNRYPSANANGKPNA